MEECMVVLDDIMLKNSNGIDYIENENKMCRLLLEETNGIKK